MPGHLHVPTGIGVLTSLFVGGTVKLMTPLAARKASPIPDDPVHVVRGAAEAAALLNPDRVRILAALEGPGVTAGALRVSEL